MQKNNGSHKTAPRSLKELQIASNMARIAVSAMAANDPRRDEALKRLRERKEALRVFMYKQKPCLTANGTLLRP